jgi:F-type H+-transporting ATPase subunit alpha
MMAELVVFENNAQGVVLNLDEDSCSIILLDKSTDIKEGDSVKTTGILLSIEVSESLIGRVVGTLGEPLDGKPKIKSGKKMPLERIAAGVIQREPVSSPVKTGIKAIDTMVPIGRGQRELIIGDRGIGKTAIAIDTIINQKQASKVKGAKPMVCVYVAIGQKQSTIAQIVEKLRETGAMDYTVIVAASASDPAALQYLAPYAGVAIAEYFMEKGQDALVVYDDLTKHAWAYRQISLVLRRPAGREAYPGDIFYLHSKLLERAVKLNKENGGGSITALPIIETQANDISAYIPTNVISITDGQIFLQPDLFNAGIRPAIDAGNSVSRVGSAAQTSAIKSVAGKMRLELAQYDNLAAFAQFGSELDEATMKQLERGKRTIEILKQPQYAPLSEGLEYLSVWLVTSGALDAIAIENVSRFEIEFHDFMRRKEPKLLEELSSGQKPAEELLKKVEKASGEFKKSFS